jgi:pimeloyl-ACP methyl ester carboxylesterase
MAFTHGYPSEVKGVVFVDASHPDQFARFRDIAGKSLAPPPGLVKFGAAFAWTGLVRVWPMGSAPASWPDETKRVAPEFLPLSVSALAKETEAAPATLDAARAFRELGDRPVAVLTAGNEQPLDVLQSMGVTREQGLRLREATRSMHDDQATWSRHARHEVVSGAGHYIQFDRPDVVIRAVREVVDDVRAPGR